MMEVGYRVFARRVVLAALILDVLGGDITATAAPAEPYYLTGGTVISMVPGQPPRKATVLVKDGRIAAILQHPILSRQDRVVDISGRYLLPGFIDMHAHVTFLRSPSDNEEASGYDRRTSELVLRELLAAGVTTVRNPAAPTAEGVRLRDDVAAGRTLGPRIFTAGWPLNGKPSTDESIRAEVDRQCALKVDYIKVYASSTPKQTAAAIEEAHKCGIKTENVSLAPQAMQETWRSAGLTGNWTADEFARMKRAWPKMLAIVNRYYRAGVLLTTGTDLPNAFVVPGVSLPQEMELLTEAGIPASDVLAMSTRNAAIALDHSADIGTIEVGKRADLVVLGQNPLSNIRSTRRVELVITNGAMLRPADLRAKVGA
jgi:imidazolonepropionase-like amidohydrolase